ncbi:MAG: ECF transporter S component [Spirochaetota bacterium]
MKSTQNESFMQLPAFRIATLAILIAVTALFTYVVRIPVAPTRGYINFGDVAIFFTAILFGPITAFITGGVGTALADLLAGYAQWAPFSFLAHGLQGLGIGLIIKAARKMRTHSDSEQVELPQKPGFVSLLIAFVVGTLIMGGIYFLTGGIMVGFAAAAAEIPGNILQNIVGILIGTPLALAVWKAYPPIRHYIW